MLSDGMALATVLLILTLMFIITHGLLQTVTLVIVNLWNKMFTKKDTKDEQDF